MAEVCVAMDSGRSAAPPPLTVRRSAAVVLGALTVLFLFLLPHHRGVIYFLGPAASMWKEAVLVGGLMAYTVFVLTRLRVPRRVVRLAAVILPFVLIVLARIAWGWFAGSDRHLLIVGGANTLLYVPLAFAVAHLLRDPAQIINGVRLYLASATAAAGVVILDWAVGISARFDYFGKTRYEVHTDYSESARRSAITFESPMVAGLFIGLGLIIAVHWWLDRTQSRRARRFSALAALICLPGLFFTFSRGPLVATACGLIAVLLFSNRGVALGAAVRRGLLLLAVGTPLLLLMAPVLLAVLPTGWDQWVLSIFDWSTDQNNQNRFLRWALGVQAVLESPWFGQGIGTGQVRLADYRYEVLGYDWFFRTPESMVLLLLLEGGLALLLAFGLIVLVTVKWTLGMAGIGMPRHIRSIGVLFLGLQVAIYTESLIMPMLDTRIFQTLFWIMVGAIAFGHAYATKAMDTHDEIPSGGLAHEPGAAAGLNASPRK